VGRFPLPGHQGRQRCAPFVEKRRGILRPLARHGKENGPQSSEGQLANGKRLEVGKRAAVCAATMFSFRSIDNTQCRDLEPLWGKGEPRQLSSVPRVSRATFMQRNLIMYDIVQTLPSTSCGDSLACTRSEGGGCLLSRPLSPFCVIWGRRQVLIYLFRDERTDNRALTVDVTGRNIPPITSSTVWLFVEAIDTRRLPPRWDAAEFHYAVRQVEMTGFYRFEPGWGRPPPTQTC
jgi:hypothetical protein